MSHNPGSIVRLTVKDFMTFSHMTVACGPKLNVICGTNGAGKSTLACAIVLGLAGKVKNLDRASNLNEFIKRGCEKCDIEIELFNLTGNIIVRRMIKRDNKSNWWINGTATGMKEVEAKMKELSIQVDNLCQFLPQDKVHDFAKMSKQELLVNTQNSVGTPFLAETFQQLIDFNKNEVSSGTELKELEKKLAVVTEKYNRLAKAMELMKQKQDLIDQIELLKKKQSWLKYEDRRKEYHEKERNKRILEKKLMKIKISAQPYIDKINNIKKSLKDAEDELARLKDKENVNHKLLKETIESAKHWQSKINVFKEKYKQILEDQKKRNDEKKVLEAHIAELEAQLNPEEEKIARMKVTELENSNQRILIELQNLRQVEERRDNRVNQLKIDIKLIEKKIKEATDVEKKKLGLLRNLSREAYEVFEFVVANQDKFNGKIYGPICTEITLDKLDFAKYFENTIPFRDMVGFVCERPEDTTKLVQMCKANGLKCNVLTAPSSNGRPVRSEYMPTVPINYLRQFSFNYYLLDVLHAPEPVLRYLCCNFRIHEIPVGSDAVLEHVDRVPREITFFFSATKKFRVNYSRYTNAKTITSVHLNMNVKFLVFSEARPDEKLQNELRELNEKLENDKRAYADAQNQTKEKELQKSNLDVRKGQYAKKISEIRFMKLKIDAFVRNLTGLSERDINLVVEEQKKDLQIKESITRSAQDLKKSAGLLKEFQNAIEKRRLCLFQIEIINRKLYLVEGEYNDLDKQVKDAERAVEACVREWKKVKGDVQQLRIAALKMTDNFDPSDPAFKQKYGDKFKKLPDDLENIDRNISELGARIACHLGSDDTTKEDYDESARSLDTLSQSIAAKKAERREKTQRIRALKDKWLPKINELVERINRKFSLFFQQMNCVGEVSLWHGDDENDFSSYGLAIRVKFRDSDTLQELDRYSQSGGERSVTIAVYMLSLQELTRVPFRCVDEINQGMDETNEKRIYHLLMESIGGSNVSQYFLITPKLLRGIIYSENVVAHVVYAGEKCTTNEQSDEIVQFLKTIRVRPSQKRRRTVVDESSDSD